MLSCLRSPSVVAPSCFFKDKVVIVTGSSNGIGRAAARMFAEKGAKVTITGRNPATLAETKEQCIKAGATPDRILEVLGDLEQDVTTQKIVMETVSKFGSIDVLVNNAGMVVTDPSGNTGLQIGLDNFDRTMAINVRSVILLVQQAVPYLEKSKGCIVNISSAASHPFLLHFEDDGYYATSKTMIDRLTVQHAGQLIGKGVRVNCINPGAIVTDFIAKSGATAEQSKMVYEKVVGDPDNIPLGRCGLPEDIASVILFLADKTQSEFIVGQCIVADGGTILKNHMLSKSPF